MPRRPSHEDLSRSIGRLVIRRVAYRPLAVESMEPDLSMHDPAPVEARRAARRLLARSSLDDEAGEGLVGAVSEVVTNAGKHGTPPVRVLGWVHDGAAVITVTDRGKGPADPEAGLQPATRRPGDGGFGLWLAHQMCGDVVMGRHDDGFTVRLVARP